MLFLLTLLFMYSGALFTLGFIHGSLGLGLPFWWSIFHGVFMWAGTTLLLGLWLMGAAVAVFGGVLAIIASMPAMLLDPSGEYIHTLGMLLVSFVEYIFYVAGSVCDWVMSNMDIVYSWMPPSVELSPSCSSHPSTYYYDWYEANPHLDIDSVSNRPEPGLGNMDLFFVGLGVGLVSGTILCLLGF